ncbi:MAG: glycosyl hydrolase family 2, partial [Muribaculaceae bacterium]|nr:glycosyl hydrolase family 2 [Muribaculaceae bacterium]
AFVYSSSSRGLVYFYIRLAVFFMHADDPTTDWYAEATVNKPFVRWWWHGSAVDPEGLSFNLEEFARQGMGGFEITPIYGVQGNEANDIPYLSDKWMDMLRHVTYESRRLGLQPEMNNGTGWPFGGPEVTEAESAQKLIIEKWNVASGKKLNFKIEPQDEKQRPFATVEKIIAVNGDTRIDITDKLKKDGTLNWTAPKKGNWEVYALFAGRTFQKVKRAAPGGEGYVVNHYDSIAVKKYLDRFDRAFKSKEETFPKVMFNDSYEVYGSDWTEGLFEEFAKDHGYRLEQYLPEFADKENQTELRGRIVRDYRSTLARVLRENFTDLWTRWAHSHGAQIRNQSHGSPANIIDLYAIVDIPECESFGRSELNIPGLHPTGDSRHSDADPAVLKFASSAAHIAGKPLVSAETLTWLTEHFHTSLSVAKPEIDQMLAAGVNHIFFHGATYSPKGVEFPGWLFYASVNMSPTNTIWKDSDALFKYITRIQSFMTAGTPDSDVLLYFPIDDIWQRQDGIYMMFDIHSMDKKMPDVKALVGELVKAGLDPDYLSDALIADLSVEANGDIISKGGNKYKSIIVPPVSFMPVETLQALKALKAKGANVIFTEHLPNDVPGLGNLEERRAEFESLKSDMAAPAKDIQAAIRMTGALPEPLRSKGVSLLRRVNEVGGHNYFLALLGDNSLNGWETLSVPAESVMIFDPLTGRKGKARTRKGPNGTTEILLQVQPGQSLLLKTFPKDMEAEEWAYYDEGNPIEINKGWSISFLESAPTIDVTFDTDTLTAWTNLPIDEAKVNAGTARYKTTFELPAGANANEWLLNLGDLRESASVKVNGVDAGKVWSVPFTLQIGKLLKPGINTLEIDVTNLPANRIADYDRKGKKWKIFKDANIASVIGKKTIDYSDWETIPSGLNSNVTITPLYLKP